MTRHSHEKRRNYFVKRRFQGLFVIKVVLALLLGLFLSMSVLVYYAGHTLTADYSSGAVSIKSTTAALLPYILLGNALAAALVVIVGVLIAVLFSHKVAGPLYRFEKSIGAIKKGELTHRIRLRSDDHLNEMKDELNLLAEFFDHRIGAMQELVEEFSSLMESYSGQDEKGREKIFEEFEKKLEYLVNHMSMFKTTKRSALP